MTDFSPRVQAMLYAAYMPVLCISILVLLEIVHVARCAVTNKAEFQDAAGRKTISKPVYFTLPELGEMEATGQSMQIDLGHWLLRFIALIIDGIIVGIIVAILFFILFIPLLFVGALGSFYASWGWVLFWPLAIGVLMFFYFLYAEVAWGGTFGKRIVGLRVQTVNGGRITYSQSIVRNISKIFWVFLLLDWLIGIATPGDRRQKYLDRVAGTVVVQVSQPFAAPPATTPPPSS
jgi:uncharacterized RDD family membrane protein YckC